MKAGKNISAYAGIAILLIILSAGPGLTQEARVEAKLDTTKLLIGDQVKLRFTFTGPAGAQILWPRIPDTLFSAIQVISRTNPDTVLSGDRKTATIHQDLILTSFDSGFYTIPPIPFYYRILPDTSAKLAETEMLILEVATVPVDTTKAIKPIKGPVRIPLSFREILPWILIAVGIAVLTAFLIYYIRRRRKHAPIFSLLQKPSLLPHEIALRDLEELRVRKIWQSGRYKEYYSELTEILRRYVEDRFAVRAMERTSDEILEGLASVEGLDPGSTGNMRKILTLADLVKFAKAVPVGSENEESLDLGFRFVKDTIPAPVAPVEKQEPSQP